MYELPSEDLGILLPFNIRQLMKPMDKNTLSDCTRCAHESMEAISKQWHGTKDYEPNTAVPSSILESTKPKIILEQQADGTIVIEQYINGSRLRTPIAEGMLAWEIKGALATQRDNQAAKLERAELRQKQTETARHKRVWSVSANSRGQGSAFADKIVGRVQRPANGNSAIADLERVCHCGQRVEPFMSRCEGCPGHLGAGKQLKANVTRNKIEKKEKTVPTSVQQILSNLV